MFCDRVYQWLETALDFGISEADFWQMTFSELDRALASKRRINKIQEQKQASFDYILADMIGRSVSRIYGSTNKMPNINEVYPSLFDAKEIEEKAQENKDKISALRFKLFAQSFNSRLGANINNE